MAQYTGSALVVKFKGTTISGRQRTLTAKEEIGLVDQSAGADVAKTYLTELEDGDAKLEVLDQRDGTAATALWNLCDKGAEGTLDWQPEGAGSNDPRHYVNAIVKNREREFPYNDVVKATITFQFSGVVTDTTNP